LRILSRLTEYEGSAMTIQVGDRIPAIEIQTMGEKGPEKVKADALFAGKRVVLFGLPGAFTPTCSRAHLPGYLANVDNLRAKGIDLVACISINDAFVMDAWGRASHCGGEITMLADGNGDLTRALDLELDATQYGMGTRSRRYSMLIDDGVVRALNVEKPGEFTVSGAEHMLERL
jgi:glutaredoxin/glutathione-dependent peroxiredoxin